MGRIAIPNIFTDSEVLSGSKLDANFAEFTTLVNTTKLANSNFRLTAGIGNDKKAFPASIVPYVTNIRQITASAVTGAVRIRGVLAYEHYSQHPVSPVDHTGEDGEVGERNEGSHGTCSLIEVQTVFHGSPGGGAGDTINVYVISRRVGGGTEQVNTLSINAAPANANSITVLAIPNPTVISYFRVDVELVPSGASVSVLDLTVSLWTRMPHIT